VMGCQRPKIDFLYSYPSDPLRDFKDDLEARCVQYVVGLTV
jgi:hypothetical protein